MLGMLSGTIRMLHARPSVDAGASARFAQASELIGEPQSETQGAPILAFAVQHRAVPCTRPRKLGCGTVLGSVAAAADSAT